MSALDILIAVPLLWAIYRGFTDGIIVQLGGLAGLFLGVWLAFRYGERLGLWLGVEPSMAMAAGFILIVVLALIAIALLGRLLRGLCKIAGLGILDHAGGVLFGLLKMSLILGLLLSGFAKLNDREHWVSSEKLAESILYRPMLSVASYAFPYVTFVKEKLLDSVPGPEKNAGDDR